MQEGEYIVRIWPSKLITLGKAIRIGNSLDLSFLSLENYPSEGGVCENQTYGMSGDHYLHRIATLTEIKIFELTGKLKIKEETAIEHLREIQLEFILN